MGRTYRRNQSFRHKNRGQTFKKFDRWDKKRRPSRDEGEPEDYMPNDQKYNEDNT